jgi:hypothetical protein
MDKKRCLKGCFAPVHGDSILGAIDRVWTDQWSLESFSHSYIAQHNLNCVNNIAHKTEEFSLNTNASQIMPMYG